MSESDWKLLLLAPAVSVACADAQSAPAELKIVGNKISWHANRPEAVLTTVAERSKREKELAALLPKLGNREEVQEYVLDVCLEVAAEVEDDKVQINPAEARELHRIADDVLLLEPTSKLRSKLPPMEDSPGPAGPLTTAPGRAPCASDEAVRSAINVVMQWGRPSLEAASAAVVGATQVNLQMLEQGLGFLDDHRRLPIEPWPEHDLCDSGVALLSNRWVGGRLYFVGDIHGDLETLEAVLDQTRFGESTESDPIHLLFLGDYGDRGDRTAAVWLRLLQLRREFPDRVLLLRGNHEELVPLRCILPSGKELARPVSLPGLQDWCTYGSLLFLCGGNADLVTRCLDSLPTAALLSDGTMAVHAGAPPRWHDKDGWRSGDAEKAPIEVTDLRDLRKPRVQHLMRWVDMKDKEDIYFSWAPYPNPRLEVSMADFAEWQSRLGIRRIVHGHTHPDGVESFPKYKGAVVGLNTTRVFETVPCIALHRPGQSPDPIRLKSGPAEPVRS
jgi:hypothetical protein